MLRNPAKEKQNKELMELWCIFGFDSISVYQGGGDILSSDKGFLLENESVFDTHYRSSLWCLFLIVLMTS